MDALKFLEERKRMCESCYDKEMECAYCEAAGDYEDCLVGIDNTEFFWSTDAWENAIKIVEKWSKEHPKKTRKSELLKNYSKALIDKRGNPIFCVKALGYEEDCGPQDNCSKCWNKEVK